PYLRPVPSSWVMPKDLMSWLQVQYDKLGRISPGTSELVGVSGRAAAATNDKAQASSLLRGIGKELYQKFAPPAFKDFFWKLVSQRGSQFRTIQIYSNDASIPWEL